MSCQLQLITFCVSTFTSLLKHVGSLSPTPGLYAQGAHELGLRCLLLRYIMVLQWEAFNTSIYGSLGVYLQWVGCSTQLGQSICPGYPPSPQPLGLWALSGPELTVAFFPFWFCYVGSPIKLVPGKAHPSSHIIAYSLRAESAFLQSIYIGKMLDHQCGMKFTGPISCHKLKSFPSPQWNKYVLN